MIIPKKSFLFPGKIVINPVMSECFPEKIEFSTGKINSVYRKDNHFTELINDISEKIPKR